MRIPKRVILNEEAVRQCFEDATDQTVALERLYTLVFEQWQHIDHIEGHLAVNDDTWAAICRMFIDFDAVHHPKVFAGGLWINVGFSSAKMPLADWEVSLDNVVVWPNSRYTLAS